MALESVVGREHELETVASFLALGTTGGHVLVLEGEAGIGKTTLWRAGVDAARELSHVVLRASPAEREAIFAYSVVSDLLEDVHDGVLTELPQPQRRALEVALLRRAFDGAAPEQHTLGVALLGVLRALAASRPVLIAVDDVQWLDPSSSAMLEFATRRLREERVALLLSRREGSTSAAGRLELTLPEERRLVLRVGPLSMGALHRLLRDRLGTTLARPALRRVHETSGGNPFFALELVRALESAGGRIRPGHPLPVPHTLEAILRERIDALPAGVREVLAEAAALREPTELMLPNWPALERAAEAGLIEISNGEVSFTHPLLASAAYGSLTGVKRRRLHRRLAEVVSDPEERARHLALGAEGPSTEVADALDGAARAAAARGAPEAAVELAELAVRLTPATERRRLLERRVETAGYQLPAGELGAAAATLERLVDELRPGGARADALLLLASAEQRFKRCLELAMLALSDACGDDARIAKIECYIAELLLIRGASEEALEHARAALASASRAGDAARLAIALSTVSWFETVSAVEPTPGLLEQAVALEEEGLRAGVSDTSSPSFVLGMRLMFSGRLEEARERMRLSLQRAATLGDERGVSAALLHLAELEFRAGNWALAAQHALEGYEHSEQTGREQDMSGLLYATALVDAHLGRSADARSTAARGIALSESCGDEVFRLQHLAVLGFLELSVGDAAAADRILRPLATRLASFGWREPSIYGELPNAIEALLELSELDEARRFLAELEDRLGRVESPWGNASAARCEGLLLAAEGDVPGAVAVLERALALHEKVAQPFDRARTLLALGTAQRRTRKRRAARETLESALTILDELGAGLWAAKARSELARIGGRTPSGDELTPSERRIAELVAEGKTNKEVAALLVIADRTVESALTQVYRKLDVRSRTELARKLAGPG
ncbi:MAG TPA: AAA family ATPase [Gaiellaceae bacterium]|jgi:DNA-binding CsgD family transcriptional regulator